MVKQPMCSRCYKRPAASLYHELCGPCLDGKPLDPDEDDERNAIFE